MKQLIIILLMSFSFGSCTKEPLKVFPEEALQTTMKTQNGETLTFEEILRKYKGKKIFVDVWASWCGDCIQGIPGVKEIQKNHPDFVYLFLSLDRNESAWKEGIQKYKLQGEHYFVPSGFKGAFGKAIDLDWIPRYMMINPDSSIELYEAVKTDDKKLQEALKQ